MRQFWITSAALLGLLVSSPAPAQSKFLAKDTKPWLQTLNTGSSEAARRNAAYALGKIGNRAAEAVPALIRRLAAEESAKVREAIAFALGEIGRESLKAVEDPNLVPALAQALKDPDALVRRSSAYALGNLGDRAEPARPALEALLKDDKAEVR